MIMNRRIFLSTLIGGVAASAAVRAFPFRVYSFPAEIVAPGPPLIASTFSQLNYGKLADIIFAYYPIYRMVKGVIARRADLRLRPRPRPPRRSLRGTRRPSGPTPVHLPDHAAAQHARPRTPRSQAPVQSLLLSQMLHLPGRAQGGRTLFLP